MTTAETKPFNGIPPDPIESESLRSLVIRAHHHMWFLSDYLGLEKLIKTEAGQRLCSDEITEVCQKQAAAFVAEHLDILAELQSRLGVDTAPRKGEPDTPDMEGGFSIKPIPD